ncbi:MAG: methionyl-tRNA formyltransferase [Actinomycetota bacterium]|nr:methionyl-tRNA formyltransferase [Actinomycetota bacterium]
MRIAVAATAQLGADVLERLAAMHDVAWLLTRPDAPRGRGRKLAPPPAKEAADRLGIPAHQAAKPELPGDVPDAIIVCAYGLYIPPRLLEQALWLNVHPSLLPRWRGAAPVERSILAGDEQTGVTIHRTVEELDAGPVAAQESFEVGELDAGGVYERSGEIAARLIDSVLPQPVFTPQPEAGATYAEKITAADRALDLDDPLDAWRRVRALSPHIGAWATLGGRRVTIWRAHLDGGRLVPELVQPAGRDRMSYDEYLRGVR